MLKDLEKGRLEKKFIRRVKVTRSYTEHFRTFFQTIYAIQNTQLICNKIIFLCEKDDGNEQSTRVCTSHFHWNHTPNISE